MAKRKSRAAREEKVEPEVTDEGTAEATELSTTGLRLHAKDLKEKRTVLSREVARIEKLSADLERRETS